MPAQTHRRASSALSLRRSDDERTLPTTRDDGVGQSHVVEPQSLVKEGELPGDLLAVLPVAPTPAQTAFLQQAYVEFVTVLHRGPTKPEVQAALDRLGEGPPQPALYAIQGWVAALAELTEATTPFRVLPADQIGHLRSLVETLPEALRGDWYLTLHAAAEYDNQRDNDIPAEDPTFGGTCNITSVAMALRGMGVDVDAERLYEVLPDDKKGQLTGYGMRASIEAVSGDKLTAWLCSAGIGKADFWLEQVRGILAQGLGVFVGCNGHVVRLQEVRDDGLVIDDPWALESILSNGKRHTDDRNQGKDGGDAAADAGADSLWPFDPWLGKAQGPQWIRFISPRPLPAALGVLPRGKEGKELGGKVQGPGLLEGIELHRD